MENKKKKLVNMFFIMVLVIIVIFIIVVIKKLSIIKILQSKIGPYINSSNYHITEYQYQGNQLIICNTYKTSDKTMTILKNLTEKDSRKLINYSVGETIHTYIESGKEKVVYLDGNNLPKSLEPKSELNEKTLSELIKLSIFSSIKIEECNGKQCYKIKYTDSQNNNIIDYYDKDTGLIIRRLIPGFENSTKQKISLVLDYFYEFDNVATDNLIEPDISQYEIR